MRLSELISAPALDGEYYDIDCDIELELAPQGNYSVYVNLALEEDGVIHDFVLDAILEFVSANIPVVLCVPFGSKIETLPLLSIVKNAGIACALLPPPKSGSDDDFNVYEQTLCEAFHFMLDNPSFSNEVIPLNGYMEYLFKEALSPSEVEGFIPSDDFILTRFHQGMDTVRSDKFKSSLKKIVLEHSETYFKGDVSSEEAFSMLAQAIFSKIVEATETELDNFNRQLQSEG
jgi:hypothetical protein